MGRRASSRRRCASLRVLLVVPQGFEACELCLRKTAIRNPPTSVGDARFICLMAKLVELVERLDLLLLSPLTLLVGHHPLPQPRKRVSSPRASSSTARRAS